MVLLSPMGRGEVVINRNGRLVFLKLEFTFSYSWMAPSLRLQFQLTE